MLAEVANDPFGPFLADLLKMGGWGALILLVLTRKLVPGWTYDEKKQESDYWRQAHDTEHANKVEQDKAVSALVEQGKTTVYVLEQIQRHTERKKSS